MVEISKNIKLFPSLENLSLNFSESTFFKIYSYLTVFRCEKITNKGVIELSKSLKAITSLQSLSLNLNEQFYFENKFFNFFLALINYQT